MKLNQGNVVGNVIVDENYDLMALTSMSKMIRVDMHTIRKASRNSSGVKIVSLDGDDKVVNIAKCAKANDEELELEILDETNLDK